MTSLDYGHLPSVTQAIAGAGLIDLTFFTEAGRERGTDVHAACQYHDEGTLENEDDLELQVALRLRQYQQFKADMGDQYAIEAIEQFVVDPLRGYIGHPDRIVTLQGRRGILDLKGPTCSKWIGLQLAAYARAVKVRFRWSLHLSDEKYHLKEWSAVQEPSDYAAFCAALTLHNWKARV